MGSFDKQALVVINEEHQEAFAHYILNIYNGKVHWILPNQVATSEIGRK